MTATSTASATGPQPFTCFWSPWPMPRGLSYYSRHAISQRLGMDAGTLESARQELIHIGLIAYQKPLYQVLALEIQLSAPPCAGIQSLLAANLQTDREGRHDRLRTLFQNQASQRTRRPYCPSDCRRSWHWIRARSQSGWSTGVLAAESRPTAQQARPV